MYAIFWFLVVIGLIGFWFLASSYFPIIGTFTSKLFNRFDRNINKDEKKENIEDEKR